jgi:hypothetical protein
MESKMTMEFMILKEKKKEERNVVEEYKHKPRSNHHKNIVVTNPSSDASISGKENNNQKKPKASFHTPSRIIFSSLTSSLVSLSLFVVLLNLAEDANASPYIMSNCLLNPQLAVDPNDALNCKYGFEVDACGTYFCSKGPKSYCGGKFERYGVCGEGLMCNKCNRCTGCSTKTFECWYDDNCIWSSD